MKTDIPVFSSEGIHPFIREILECGVCPNRTYYSSCEHAYHKVVVIAETGTSMSCIYCRLLNNLCYHAYESVLQDYVSGVLCFRRAAASVAFKEITEALLKSFKGHKDPSSNIRTGASE